MNPYTHTYIHTYIHTYTHTYNRTHIQPYTHKHIQDAPQEPPPQPPPSARGARKASCTYIHTYSHTYIQPHIHKYKQAPTRHAKLSVKGGIIHWYPTDRRFEAFCSETEHGFFCRQNRMATGHDSYEHQGRPLGYLVAWLAMDEGPKIVHADDHVHVYRPSLQRRQTARATVPQNWLAAERPPRPGEPDEPTACP